MPSPPTRHLDAAPWDSAASAADVGGASLTAYPSVVTHAVSSPRVSVSISCLLLLCYFGSNETSEGRRLLHCAPPS